MSEAQRIVALSQRARAQGEQLCLATVVHVEGSAYRKPGARMLVTSGGERAGTISGGCLEAEVSRKAWWLTANGARVERYSSFPDEDGGMPYGLGCGGTVSLLLEQGEPVQAVLSTLDRVLSTRQPAVVVTSLGAGDPQTSSLANGDSGHHSLDQPPPAGTLAVLALQPPGTPDPPPASSFAGWEAWQLLYLRSSAPANNHTLHPSLLGAVRSAFAQRLSCLLTSSYLPCSGWPDAAQPIAAPAYFIEYLAAPPAVTIFGAGDDAQPIAELAHLLGWRVTIADGRAHLARRDRFPHAAQVRVLDYADPALRAACGMPRTPPPAVLHLASTWPPAEPSSDSTAPQSTGSSLLSDDIVIVLTHSYEQDRALLTALLPRDLLYLGLLGPRHRTERLLLEVAPTLGLSLEAAFARLHSPIGLDLGAGDPSAVALSIVAEIQAVLHDRHVAVTHAPSAVLPSQTHHRPMHSNPPAESLEAALPADLLA